MNPSTPTPPTLIERFYHWEKTTPEKIFLRQPKGDQWKTLTYAEAGLEARKMVSALQKNGLQNGDHVGIYSKNCYHWILADLAIMMGGFVSVPLYASLPKDQLAEVVELGDLKAIFLGKLDAWGNRSEAIPASILAIRFPQYAGNAEVSIGEDWDALIADSPAYLDNFVPGLDDLWTIKFTSGTTGTPKGVMHVHRSPAMIMFNELKTDWIGVSKLEEIRTFSYLPLNHVGERIGVELPTLWMGGTMSFAESLDTFAKNLQDTQPTLLFAVPRIWTKFYLGVTAKIPQKRLTALLKIPIISTLIKKKLRTAMGMRDLQIAGTGAAITPAFIKAFFQQLGIHLTEAYGMTEVCGSMTNGPDANTPNDSVGKAIPFGAVKLAPETGEILMSSPYMMKGYYKNPEKTAEVLIDGWMHSGDRGTIDDNGFVRVIGRVKDAFKTSKGSYVTPNPLEEAIMKNEYVEQVCVAGLGIPQPIALVNLSEIGAAANRHTIEQSVYSTVQQINGTRAKYERISTVIIQQEHWSIDNELLTPTLKVKRGKIDERFGQDYLTWHEADGKVLWV
ncbi:MAG: AMP-binding protein [Saprospiraceae bacterium]|nr:AMP-binding protein [Saprospiraceae bacterium]